ncbi:hypothetical protein K3495_g9389 [Podosphaera aphanis]|nr:hypothetical protein K3495_g9389 [Podosphaera aphanis]
MEVEKKSTKYNQSFSLPLPLLLLLARIKVELLENMQVYMQRRKKGEEKERRGERKERRKKGEEKERRGERKERRKKGEEKERRGERKGMRSRWNSLRATPPDSEANPHIRNVYPVDGRAVWTRSISAGIAVFFSADNESSNLTGTGASGRTQLVLLLQTPVPFSDEA